VAKAVTSDDKIRFSSHLAAVLSKLVFLPIIETQLNSSFTASDWHAHVGYSLL